MFLHTCDICMWHFHCIADQKNSQVSSSVDHSTREISKIVAPRSGSALPRSSDVRKRAGMVTSGAFRHPATHEFSRSCSTNRVAAAATCFKTHQGNLTTSSHRSQEGAFFFQSSVLSTLSAQFASLFELGFKSCHRTYATESLL